MSDVSAPSAASPPPPKRRFRKERVPQHFTLPAAMIATRSANASASSMWCVVRSTDRSTRTSRSRVQTSRRATGSIPAVGSSRTTSLDPPVSAAAIITLRFWPPESLSGNPSAISVRRKSSSRPVASFSALASSTPLSRE